MLQQLDHVKLLFEHVAQPNKFISHTTITTRLSSQHDRRYHKTCRNFLYDTSLVQVSIYVGGDDSAAVLQVLLDNGEDPDSRSGGLANPVNHVYSEEQWPYAETLVRAGANVNARGPDGSRPIHWAAQMGNVRAINLLLEYDADINTRHPGNNGSTPLILAVRQGKSGAVMALLDKGAD
ncbi:hypothetical protein ACHAQH_004101 [Verticillium albo-atrum]